MSNLNKPLATDVIRFTVTTKTVNGSTVYQAVGTIGSGWGPASVKRVDGKATFPNRRAIVKAINRRASALGMRPEIKYVRATEKTASSKSTAGRNSNRNVSACANRKG
jgi:hypothetical protein